MKINLFNGGLNTRLDPLLLQSNEAIEIENVDTSTGAIKAVLGTTATTITSTPPNVPFYFESEDEWQDRAAVSGYIEHQGKLYWATNTFPNKYDGTDTELLGIVEPGTLPTVVVTNLADPGLADEPTITQTNSFLHTLTLGTAATGGGTAGTYEISIAAYRDGIAFNTITKQQTTTGTDKITATITQSAGAADYAIDTAVHGSQIIEIDETIYLIGGTIAGPAATDKVFSAPRTDPTNWTDLGAVLPAALTDSQALVIGNFVYLFGGDDTDSSASSIVNKIYRAPISDLTDWSDVGTIHTAVCKAQIVQAGSNIYLLGGLTAGPTATDIIQTATVADPLTWTDTGDNLPTALYDSQVLTVGTNIYLFGGNDGSEVDTIFTATVAAPTTWTDTTANLPAALSKSQIILFNENLYLLGGLANSSIYTASENTPTVWTDTGDSLFTIMYDSQALVIDNFAYLFGGYVAAPVDSLFIVHVDTPTQWVWQQNVVRVFTTTLANSMTTYTEPVYTTPKTLDGTLPSGMVFTAGESIIIGVSIFLGDRTSIPTEVEIAKSEDYDKIIEITAAFPTGDGLVYYSKLGDKFYEFYRGVKTVVEYPAKVNLILADTWVAGGLNGTYQYGYTYYNEDDGTESQLSPVSVEAVPVNDSVTLSNLIPSSDSQVTHYKIYRVGENLLKFTFIKQLAITETSYIDTVEDSLITGKTFTAYLNGSPITGLKYLRHSYGLFVGAVDSKFYFTRDIGNPNYWPETYYIDFYTTITGIGVSADGIIVFTKYKAYVISGTSASTFVKYQLSGDQGCLNHDTIAELGGNLLFVSTDGICIQTRGGVNVISKLLLGKIELSTINAVIYDEVYYIQLTDGRILAYDFRYEPSIKYYNFNTNYLVVAKDTLYGRKNDNLLHTLFTGSATSYTYKTGELTDGLASDRKEYNTIYFYSTGINTVEIFLDNVSVGTKVLNEGFTEYSISQATSRGSKIQFEFTGTGTVNEIDYTPVGRLVVEEP